MKWETHSKLAAALLSASFVLSAAFGGGEWLLKLSAMESRFVKFSTQELENFTSQNINEPPGQALEIALRSFMIGRAHAPSGHLVAARVLDAEGKVLAQTDDGRKSTVQAVDRYMPDVPFQDAPSHEVFWNDEVYVRVVAPVRFSDKNQTVYLNGLYRVEPVVIEGLKLEAIKSAGMTILVVFVTALFIYPLVLYLDRNLTRRTRQLLDANTSMLEALGAAIAKRDSETGSHNYRVAYYAVKLGEAAGLSRTHIVGLLKGAFLHDIGKIGVRDAILLKPGKLTSEEFKEMQTHVDHGLDIVKGVTWFEDADEVIGGHHEKWDGSGYPLGLMSSDIPLSARIFAIADVFDALTSRRPYKEAFPLDQSMTIMVDGRGHHFDPSLLDLFLGRCEKLYNEVNEKDAAALKKLLTSCTCHYLDGVL